MGSLAEKKSVCGGGMGLSNNFKKMSFAFLLVSNSFCSCHFEIKGRDFFLTEVFPDSALASTLYSE